MAFYCENRFMKKLIFLLLITMLIDSSMEAQFYEDHFGTGHDFGVSVSSSSITSGYEENNTLNGTGYFLDELGASRFLSHATFGPSYEDINYLTQIGVDAWLEEQFALPSSSYLDTYQSIYQEAMSLIEGVYGEGNTDTDRRRDYLYYTFYEKVCKDPDVLRQKVAFALSQILVVSTQSSILDNRGFATSSYYDVLYQGAFGNFRDLLHEVTLHPAMGIYLSHFKNVKANPANGTLPDENYAREIMQLFTIGLYELNNDGTRKLDASENVIPTYDIEDIQELAKVFTGLSGSAWDLILKPENAGTSLTFNKGYNHYDLTQPMAMYQDYHETSEKMMIDGSVIPANQAGMQDIDDALDVLFNHDNVAPFISYRLIQQLVKSNPSPNYVNRISTVFNDNGSGVKGDLQAVVKAILTDPEAIDCEWTANVTHGKLVPPVERFTNLFRAFDVSSPSGKLWFRDFNEIYGKVEQSFLAAPSVFNYFTPFYAATGILEDNDLVSPEFQILNATTGINSINLIENAIDNRPFANRTAVNPNNLRLTTNNDDEPFLDFSDEIAIYNADGLEALIDRVDLLLCAGELSEEVKEIIVDAVGQMEANNSSFTDLNVVEEVIYFVMMSPSYMISK